MKRWAARGIFKRWTVKTDIKIYVMICKYIDEVVVVGSGMGLFLIVGDWPRILPQNSKRGQLNVCTV